MKNKDNLAKEIERREEANKYSPFPVYDREEIKDLKEKRNMLTKKDDYNNVPVHYCKTCLSIKLKEIDFPKELPGEKIEYRPSNKVTYCLDCGNTEIESAHIEEWEELYIEKKGTKFLNEE